MKFTIAFKRQRIDIDGAFAICISKEDLRSLKKKISNLNVDDHTYGWLFIDEYLPSSEDEDFDLIQRHKLRPK